MSLEVFNQKKALVTGAAGFIGSNLSTALIAAGAEVVGVDNFLTGRQANVTELQANDHFQFIQADVIQPPSNYLPQGYIPDFIFHFASPASPPLYQAHPIETYQVNTVATHELLQFIVKNHAATHFLFAGTSEVYGDPAVHPQPETYWGNVNPNGVRSCYDEAKRLGETICGVHQRNLGVDVRIVRIFNTYGPHMNPEDGRILPQFISQALANQPLTLYGEGNQTRSYCYVDDLVKGVLLLAATDGLSGKTVNLGNPAELTVSETLNIVDKMVNGQDHEPEIKHQPLPQDDPTRRKPDIALAKELLNWQPEIDFNQGLEKTIAYFRQALQP